jgi:hypothetical protein
VVVTSGVRIGERCVIGANSVVTADIEPFSVAAGAPAKVLRRVEYAPAASSIPPPPDAPSSPAASSSIRPRPDAPSSPEGSVSSPPPQDAPSSPAGSSSITPGSDR